MGEVAKKLEPQGEWLSESEIAKRVKLHRQTVVSRLEDLGRDPDLDRSTAKLKIHWFDDELAFELKAAKDTVGAMKIRDLRATAQLKELKLAEARGELVPFNDATERMQAVVSKMYKELGLQLPKRVASRLLKAKTAAEITKIIKVEVGKVFAKLRENDEEFVPGVK